MGTVCDLFLAREEATLSPFAFRTANSKGRAVPIDPCPNRTEFQRDRDKIIHSKAFRRMMHKTQVFFSPVDEHYRTRMTHTLEVSQIARIIARALMLNEDLAEAIALGHDLGHTPFGHAGERAMRECYDPSFAHYAQSLRVVDLLEKNGKGLNLTFEVRDGIYNHKDPNQACTLEGVVVKFADKIAYINHDIDDACRGGILTMDDIPKTVLDLLGRGHGQRVNTMVSSVIEYSKNKPEIGMMQDVFEATEELHTLMFRQVYKHPIVQADEKKAIDIIKQLFDYYKKHPEEIPMQYYQHVEQDGVERCVCDYISGMTDRYAVDTYASLFIPSGWKGLTT